MKGSVDYTPPVWAKGLNLRPSRRCGLAHLPTPIEAWAPPGLPDEIRVSIKRDDLTGMVLSGNKVRKLEFLLAEAEGCDTVLTCGGIQSNHCRATALAACRSGMESVLFLRTDVPDADPGLEGNLLLDRMAGAELRLITGDQYADRTNLMTRAASELRRAGRRPCVIPEGGSNGLGSWGYIEAARELLEQIAALNEPVTDVVLAMGSGGTGAGLALGLCLAGSDIRVHAVNVCDDAAYFHREVNRIYGELGATNRSEDVLSIIEGYVGEGYARSRDEELVFLRDVVRDTGIVLDPVYTGKAARGMVEEAQANLGRFQGRHILFVHTGGLFGLYAQREQIGRHLR